MSTTTAADLLARAELLSRELRRHDGPVTAQQWAAFDVTAHRLLTELLGPLGVRVPEAHAALRAVVERYPRPLTGPVHDAHSEPIPRPRAGGTERPETVRTQRGHLHSVSDEEHVPRPALDVEALAGVTDPHPLARLTCTFGALADLLQGYPGREQTPPDLDGLTDTTRRVLAISAVAAHHTLAHAPLAYAERPFTVGHHAEACLGALEPGRPGVARWLLDVAAVHVDSTPAASGERLDFAVAEWARASDLEMRAAVPSLDSLRTLTRQGTHLLATADALLTDGVQPPLPEAQARTKLREALAELARADQAWPNGATTLTQPGHSFVAASRELHEALEPLRLAAHELDATERVNAVTGLMRATSHLSRHLTSERDLPARLARSGLLFAPARALTPADTRLDDRKHGRHIPAALDDIHDLVRVWHDAVDKLRQAHMALAYPSQTVDVSMAVMRPSL